MNIILSADDFGSTHSINLAIDYAMRNGLACSTAVIMGSEYTDEAIQMAIQGNYIQNVHCHLNLSSGLKVGKHFVPQNEEYKNSRFCENGEYGNAWYYKPDFYKMSDVVYKELVSQYEMFKNKTKGQGNYDHVDFHKYLNMSPPVAVAYRKLIAHYHIHSARFYAEQWKTEKGSRKRHLVNYGIVYFAKRNNACVVKSSRINYYLHRPEEFTKEDTIELFVHPDYKKDILIDTTKNVFGNEIMTLSDHIDLVRGENICFISWSEYNRILQERCCK